MYGEIRKSTGELGKNLNKRAAIQDDLKQQTLRSDGPLQGVDI